MPLRRFGLPDRFIEHGSVALQRADCGMDSESFARAFVEALASTDGPHS